jgi:hypothetical protein
MRPTWTSPGRVDGPAWPCTGRGLPCAPTSPRRRCALTAPFHLCLCATHVWPRHRPSALCGTFPRVSPGGRYPPPSPFGVRTFLEGINLRDCLARKVNGTREPSNGRENQAAWSTQPDRRSERTNHVRERGDRASRPRCAGLQRPRQERCEPQLAQPSAVSTSTRHTGQLAGPSRRKASQAPRTTSSSVTSDGLNNLCALPSSCGRPTTTAVSVARATLTRPSGKRRRHDREPGCRGCEVASCSCSPAAAGRDPSP